ncbi:sensor histidine kinase [Streptomyces orinoci]|uniref:histidine kinase n=1 Tax=Streptomyces orinoci TaxID=67339 RepID=A0ABV3K5U1_STRON|nr:sensor histidine kinase [Streptomyces orinoci]
MWRDRAAGPPAGRPPRLAWDLPLALGFTAAALLLARTLPPVGWRPPDGLAYALAVPANLALAARRYAPVAVCALYLLLWPVLVAAGFPPVAEVPGALLACSTVAAARPPHAGAGWVLACAVVWPAVALPHAGPPPAHGAWWPVAASAAAPSLPAVWWLAHGARQLARHRARLSEVTAQLGREQAGNAGRALAEVRMRIARELHDVVAHHMSVISVQAGLAHYVFTTDPGTARGALGAISATSGEAQAELRRLLAVLRTGPEGGPEDTAQGAGEGPYQPMPGLDGLETAVARVRAAGVPVRLEIAGHRRRLPPGPDLCAYRVAQEALANVVRHARPASATVRLEFHADRLELRITDDGRVANPPGPGPVEGHGLLGMRERARIYRGTLVAGPRADGGFEVRLTLPR